MQKQTQRASLAYRPDIDGIRAVAVLSVFLYHLRPDLLPGGFLGVDIFFIISGYLISTIILQHHQGSFSFTNFYARRVKRIFPALFVLLTVTALVAIILLPPETYSNHMRSARYASAQLANFFFSKQVGYFDEGFFGQPLLHTWSLGVEEQFYLFWPVLILLSYRYLAPNKSFRPISWAAACSQGSKDNIQSRTTAFVTRFSLVLLAIFVASYLLCYWLIERNYNLAFYMFYTRAFEFCIGGALALRILPELKQAAACRIASLTGMLLVCYSLFGVGEEYAGHSFLYFGVLIPCVGTALLIHVRWHKAFANRLLASPLPNFIGRVSYSLYLYHWPVIIFWKIYTGGDQPGIVACLAIFLLSLALATLSYYLVEQPARRTGRSDRTILVAALLLIIFFTFSFKLLEEQATADWRIKQYDEHIAALPSPHAPQCRRLEKSDMVYYVCAQEDDVTSKRIVLAGDSHALHYLRGATAWAADNGYDVKYLGTAGCPMLFGDIALQQRVMAKEYEEQCLQALPRIKEEILEDPLVEMILLAQRFELLYDGKGYSQNSRILTFKTSRGETVENHTAYYRQQLLDTIRTIERAGKKVILLLQVPLFPGIDNCDYQPLLKEYLKKPRQCRFDRQFISKWQQPSIDFIKEFAEKHNIALYDPFPAITSPLQNGVNIYEDTDHINNHGFQFLIPHFIREMDRIAAERYGKIHQE